MERSPADALRRLKHRKSRQHLIAMIRGLHGCQCLQSPLKGPKICHAFKAFFSTGMAQYAHIGALGSSSSLHLMPLDPRGPLICLSTDGCRSPSSCSFQVEEPQFRSFPALANQQDQMWCTASCIHDHCALECKAEHLWQTSTPSNTLEGLRESMESRSGMGFRLQKSSLVMAAAKGFLPVYSPEGPLSKSIELLLELPDCTRASSCACMSS